MIVQCPRCQTKYNLDDKLIAPQGSQVQCSRCKHFFVLTPPPEEEPPAEPKPVLKPIAPQPAMSRREREMAEFLDEPGPAAEGDLEEVEGEAKSKWLKKVLVGVIIFVLATVLLFGAVIFLKTRGLHLDKDYLKIDLYEIVPFLKPGPAAPEKPGPPQAQDPGNKRIHLQGVQGSFLELAAGGRCFVIRGKVKNAYGHPVSEVKLRGLLHTQAKRNAVETLVFGGHRLSDKELAGLSRSVVEGTLGSPVDKTGAALILPPGETTDLVAVFYDLPENLVEYTVEVVSSKPEPEAGKKK